MQNYKDRFRLQDNGKVATLQSCIRTNDINIVGDGIHLTYFEMLGNFHFSKNNDFEYAINMWASILCDLNIAKECLAHIHPDRVCDRIFWETAGFSYIDDDECIWSDGDIGGTCCEVYWNGIEIGNLVNTLGTCTDVGFGLERLVMAVEGKRRVDETSLFDVSLSPIARDHVRTLDSFWINNIPPGNKGRNYICRKLLRRLLKLDLPKSFVWDEWLFQERRLRQKCLNQGRKMWKRHRDKSHQWWWETCGLTEDDVSFLHDVLCTSEFNTIPERSKESPRG